MLHDLNSDEVGPFLCQRHVDVCIGGAGVAGITLALKLAVAGRSVLLLEGGGSEISSESQELYRGENLGMDYYDLQTCRLRYLGGTSNHWNGLCRPMDAHDFEHKAHIPYSGWPISKTDILPYEEETYDILDIANRVPPDAAFVAAGGLLNWVEMTRSAPTRFRKKYGQALTASKRIDLVLNANVIDYELDEAGSRIVSVVCRSHAAPGHDHRFTADHFVLAMGGIENARALLNADGQMSGGIGNRHDLVGRFFSEHPKFPLGMYWECQANPTRRFLATTLALMRSERIAQCAIRLRGYAKWPIEPSVSDEDEEDDPTCDFEAAQRFFENIGNYLPFEGFGNLTAVVEQTPNRDSRVTLSDTRDKLGLRTTALDWRLSPIERRTVKICALEMAKAFARDNIGRVKLPEWVFDDALPIPSTDKPGGRHHMGTTRMSNDPRTGVVDQNCRVFGVQNLYVAGSSVFASTGHANPTFTIVQLTLRLADHLSAT